MTKDKALKLWDLLERRLSPDEAREQLFALFGHEELFEEFDQADENADVRPSILKHLKDMLWNSPPCYRNAWQDEAWKICEAAVYQRRMTALS